jgi:hypothetical protein
MQVMRFVQTRFNTSENRNTEIHPMLLRLRLAVVGLIVGAALIVSQTARAASDSWVYTQPVTGLIDAGVTFPGSADVRLVDTATGTIEMPAQDGDIFRIQGDVTNSGYVANRAYLVVNTPASSNVFQLGNGVTGVPVVNVGPGAPTAIRMHHWNDPANWLAGGVPNGVGEVASFGALIETGQNTRISLDSDVTLGRLEWTGTGPGNRDFEMFGGVIFAKRTLTFATSDGSTPSIVVGGTRPFSLVGTNVPDTGLNIAGNQGLYLETPPAIRGGTSPNSAIRVNPGLSWTGFSGTLTLGQGNLDPVAGGLFPAVRFVLGTGLDEAMSPRYARLGMFSGRNQTFGGFDGNSNSWVGNNSPSITGFSTLTVGSNDESGDFAGTFGRNDATDATDPAGPLFRSNIHVTKIGTGTQRFSGTSLGSGTTTVNGGTFLMNGVHTATGTTTGNLAATAGTFGAYAVNNGGALVGTGTITPFDTDGTGNAMIGINDGGVLSPGDGGTGTFTIDGGSSVNPLVAFAADAGNGGGRGLYDLGAAGSSDVMALVNGDVNDVVFSSTVLDFNVLGGATSGDYTLFTADVAGAYSGLTIGGGGVITGGLSIGGGLGAGSTLKLVGNDIIVSAVITTTGLPGDYNDDGVVDAVDYTVWRNNLGDPTEADINDNGDGQNGVDPADYGWWKQHYGDIAPGAGGGGLAGNSVPEPTSATLILLAGACLGAVRGRGLATGVARPVR